MPVHIYMEPFTYNCLRETEAALSEHNIKFLPAVVTGIPDVAKARNKCVEAFLEDKSYTHLMWIDADMVWSPDAVLTLLSHNAPAVSALVTKKAPAFAVTLFQIMQDETENPNTYEVPFGSYPLDKPFTLENSGIGTAFMLLKREVIEKMEPPWFAGFTSKKGQLKGTDFLFCIKVLTAGYEFIYDPRPRVYHVGKCFYGIEDHIAYVEHSENGGAKACPFTSISAESVAKYKSSFAGPQPSQIAEVASAVAKQLESFQCQAESKSEISSCPSLSEGDLTNLEKKTGIEVPR